MTRVVVGANPQLGFSPREWQTVWVLRRGKARGDNRASDEQNQSIAILQRERRSVCGSREWMEEEVALSEAVDDGRINGGQIERRVRERNEREHKTSGSNTAAGWVGSSSEATVVAAAVQGKRFRRWKLGCVEGGDAREQVRY